MPQGYYTVNATPDQQDIVFHSLANSTAPIPDDQVALMSAIEQTIPVLRKVFQGRHSEFSRYFNNLLSLAQGGLVGSDAQPAVAQRALLNLRTEVVDNEAERVKTRYMAKLGKLAAFFALPAIVIAAAAHVAGTFPILISEHGFVSAAIVENLGWFVTACAVGVWLSFGVRKQAIGFFDLDVPEKDYLSPVMRLAFAEVMALGLSLLFTAGVLELRLGRLSSAAIYKDALAALVFGLLAGLSEQALPRQLAQQAQRIAGAGSNKAI